MGETPTFDVLLSPRPRIKSRIKSGAGSVPRPRGEGTLRPAARSVSTSSVLWTNPGILLCGRSVSHGYGFFASEDAGDWPQLLKLG